LGDRLCLAGPALRPPTALRVAGQRIQCYRFAEAANLPRLTKKA
jgi:hypothetical protein